MSDQPIVGVKLPDLFLQLLNHLFQLNHLKQLNISNARSLTLRGVTLASVIGVNYIAIHSRWKLILFMIFTRLVVSSEVFSAFSTPEFLLATGPMKSGFHKPVSPDSTLILRIRTSDLTKSRPSSNWQAWHLILTLYSFLLFHVQLRGQILNMFGSVVFLVVFVFVFHDLLV